MKALNYYDICLVPEFGTCTSRSECSTDIKFGGKTFKLPVVPANMKSVINIKIAKWMSERDYFYIMHRFDIDILKFINQANSENWRNISISLGVKNHDEKIIEYIREKKLRVDFITIDIAHGYCNLMKEMIGYIREAMGDSCFIIAGNVCNPEAVAALASWGADAVKVGIGQGSPCTTKDKTGFTMPMFTSVLKCGKTFASQEDFVKNRRIPIIADGAVQSNGDIAKALVAGADMVMAGSLFAACIDSPALVTSAEPCATKGYFGSASSENKGNNRHIEGKMVAISSNEMSYEQKLYEVKEDLQSSISYAGGKDLNSFEKTKYLIL